MFEIDGVTWRKKEICNCKLKLCRVLCGSEEIMLKSSFRNVPFCRKVKGGMILLVAATTAFGTAFYAGVVLIYRKNLGRNLGKQIPSVSLIS